MTSIPSIKKSCGEKSYIENLRSDINPMDIYLSPEHPTKNLKVIQPSQWPMELCTKESILAHKTSLNK